MKPRDLLSMPLSQALDRLKRQVGTLAGPVHPASRVMIAHFIQDSLQLLSEREEMREFQVGPDDYATSAECRCHPCVARLALAERRLLGLRNLSEAPHMNPSERQPGESGAFVSAVYLHKLAKQGCVREQKRR